MGVKDRRVFVDLVEAPPADLVVAVDEQGSLVRVGFLRERAFEDVDRELAEAGYLVDQDPLLSCEAVRQLSEYFEGGRQGFELRCAPRGTSFQKAVWQAVGEIPYGTTLTYAELARRVGRPRATRAVGRANGQNPIAVVVPCHRVVGTGGQLTGYAAGLPLKKWLLSHEGAAAEQPSLPLGTLGERS